MQSSIASKLDLKILLLSLPFILPLSGCTATARPAVAPEPLELCASARPGAACELSVEDGAYRVTSRCDKQLDGSLVCDSPDVPLGGPRVSTNAAQQYGPR